jgi:hypothetical protein
MNVKVSLVTLRLVMVSAKIGVVGMMIPVRRRVGVGVAVGG